MLISFTLNLRYSFTQAIHYPFTCQFWFLTFHAILVYTFTGMLTVSLIRFRFYHGSHSHLHQTCCSFTLAFNSSACTWKRGMAEHHLTSASGRFGVHNATTVQSKVYHPKVRVFWQFVRVFYWFSIPWCFPAPRHLDRFSSWGVRPDLSCGRWHQTHYLWTSNWI